jgi:hypothetical protein
MNKTYLGDGVYVTVDEGTLVLTAENGIRALETIYLEPEVFRELVKFEASVRAG